MEVFSGFLKIRPLIYLVSGLTPEDLRPLLKKVLTPLKLILGLCPLLKHSPTLTESELQLIVEAFFYRIGKYKILMWIRVDVTRIVWVQ